MRYAWLCLLVSISSPSIAQDYPLRLASPGGEVILPTAGARTAHDTHRFATARRVGNMLYVSGVIVTRRPGEGNDAASLQLQTRRAFDRLNDILAASGTSFAAVAKITSFHVWQGPDFAGTHDEQFRIVSEVLGEYIEPPYPAWTAVGTTGLLGTGGIVEIELIAHVAVSESER